MPILSALRELSDLIASATLASTFAAASIAKLRDRPRFAVSLRELGLPAVAVPLLLVLVPAGEVTLAAALIVAPDRRVPALAALLMLTSFTIVLGANVKSGRAVSCACFGSSASGTVGGAVLLRNFALGAVSVSLMLPTPSLLRDLISATAIGTVAYSTRGGRRSGATSAESPPASVPALPPAPAFRLPALRAGFLDLQNLTAEGKPVLLVFVHTECHVCHALTDELASWRTDGAPLAVIVGGGSTERWGQVTGAAIAADSSVFSDYGVIGTPAAVVVSPSGKIVRPIVHGLPDVRAMMRTLKPVAERLDRRRFVQVALRVASGAAMMSLLSVRSVRALGARLAIAAGAAYSGNCANFPDWVKQNGIPCKGGVRAPGCSTCQFSTDYTPDGEAHEKNGQWCGTFTVHGFTVKAVTSIDTVELDPSDGQSNSPSSCKKEWDRFRRENNEHEKHHNDNCKTAAASAQHNVRDALHGKRFTVCGDSREALTDKVGDEVDTIARPILAAQKENANKEPKQPKYPECSKCPCDSGGKSVARRAQTGGSCQPPPPPPSPPPPAPPPPPEPELVYCGCTGFCYTDPVICLANCKVSLACFTQICGPALPGQCAGVT